jgi:hypothetical protein
LATTRSRGKRRGRVEIKKNQKQVNYEATARDVARLLVRKEERNELNKGCRTGTSEGEATDGRS